MDPSALSLVETLCRDGDYAEARRLLEEAIREDPRNPGLRARLGQVLRSCGEHVEAVNQYAESARILVDEAVSRGPGELSDSFEEVTTSFGAVLPMVRPASFDAARSLLGRTLDFARVRTETGVSLLELGDVPTARRVFCEAVEFLPAGADYDEPWLWLTRIEAL